MKKIIDLQPSDFPGVNPQKFEEWKQATHYASRRTNIVWIVLIVVNSILFISRIGGPLVYFLLCIIAIAITGFIQRPTMSLLKELGMTQADIKRVRQA